MGGWWSHLLRLLRPPFTLGRPRGRLPHPAPQVPSAAGEAGSAGPPPTAAPQPSVDPGEANRGTLVSSTPLMHCPVGHGNPSESEGRRPERGLAKGALPWERGGSSRGSR